MSIRNNQGSQHGRKTALPIMKQSGLMQGKGNPAFAPRDLATRRDEAVTALLNMWAQKSKCVHCNELDEAYGRENGSFGDLMNCIGVIEQFKGENGDHCRK
ncbi:hypothetical protein LOZ80_28615 [Paenibacillus sp. HWE-109]|uniref:hypothetical protein n=1 Tax=Paenibacillus sp. HWE-109 TaxID=1306526 RepID=UPI001EDDC03B|nr:hypothetical protein [Paenibacillus sp. HWE-109]UKS25521.1 hypothetical protein LOZ80_28615 [Paenibacillus sp. HWE-109]